jgi:heme A synthase
MIDPMLSASIPLHAITRTSPPGLDLALVPILAFGGLASAALAGLGIIAFSRRRSRSYLLIALALVALALKALLGGLWVIEVIPTMRHDLLEHGLDLSIAAFLIAAVYYARATPIGGEVDTEETRIR